MSLEIQWLLTWLVVLAAAAFFNRMLTVVNFSFTRMRKRYIEDSDETDPAQLKKVAPWYEKTSQVIAATQIGTVLTTGFYFIALYHIGDHLLSILEREGVDAGEPVVWAAFIVLAAAAVFLYWLMTILVPGARSLVRPLPMLSSHTRVLGVVDGLFRPFTKLGISIASSVLEKQGIPFRDEVNFTYTEDEIRCIVEESHKGGRLSALENKLIKNSFDFFDLDVEDVMIPRSDMVVLDFDDDMETLHRTVTRANHTRYPVCEGDKDHILGFLHVKEFMESYIRGDRNVKPILRDILTVPETMPAPALLQLMKNRRIYLAVVVNEYGNTTGLVTLEDLTVELVGELPQEADPEPPEVVRHDDGSFEFDGTVILSDVEELLDVDIEDETGATIGGFVFSELERIPKVGDAISFGGWTFTVEKMRGFRIARVRADKEIQEAGDGTEA